MEVKQNELDLFDETEKAEETEKSDDVYVYHKSTKAARLYGEVNEKKHTGFISIYFDKADDQKIRKISESIYQVLQGENI